MNTYEETSYGGINLGGENQPAVFITSPEDLLVFGVTCAGSSFSSVIFEFTINTKIVLSGQSDFGKLNSNFLTLGGISAHPYIELSVFFNFQNDSGYLRLSGGSFVDLIVSFSGGISLSPLSEASFSFNPIILGFIKVSGKFDNNQTVDFLVDNFGLVSQGTSLVRSRYLNVSQGVCFAAGEFILSDNFISFGGTRHTGFSAVNLVMREVRGLVIGGLKPSGKNLLNVNNNFFVTSSGSLFAEGSGFYFINDTLFVSEGGLSLKSDGTLLNFKFNKDIEFNGTQILN